MISRRIFFAGLIGAFLPAALAHAQTPHWLIGEWIGVRDQGTTTRHGSDRILVVSRVAADGKSAQAVWVSSGRMSLKVTIDGERIGFSTTTPTVAGAEYKLERKGDTLSGVYVNSANAQSANITLTKKK